jgi:uncharacterized protein YjiS (DUF1127 family)
MNMFQFAVASIVDVNTGNGLIHVSGPRDYAAAENHGRKIRSQSIIELFAQIKSAINGVFKRYQARLEQRRNLRNLLALNDHLLEDIGLHRGDLAAVQLGVISLDELKASHRSGDQAELKKLEYVAAPDRISRNLAASNAQLFEQRKCA